MSRSPEKECFVDKRSLVRTPTSWIAFEFIDEIVLDNFLSLGWTLFYAYTIFFLMV